MRWRNETNKICRELSRKNEFLFQFILLNFKDDADLCKTAHKNRCCYNGKKYWFLRNRRWAKELTGKNTVLLSHILRKVKLELAAHDSSSRNSNTNGMKYHWGRAKKILMELKASGFEKEAREFIKTERRTIKLIYE